MSEKNRKLPHTTHYPSIWPHHSISTWCRNTPSYTLSLSHTHMHGLRHSFSLNTHYSVDLSNTQAALCSASSNNRTIQHITIQLHTTFSKPKQDHLCLVGLRPAVFQQLKGGRLCQNEQYLYAHFCFIHARWLKLKPSKFNHLSEGVLYSKWLYTSI